MVIKRLSLIVLLSLIGGLANAQSSKTTSFYFDSDVSVLGTKELNNFKKFIGSLDSTQVISICLVGYCDDKGSKGYNDTLSRKRADFVQTLLEKKGYHTAKVSFLAGNGKVGLLNAKNIEEQRAQNRRVDIVVLQEDSIVKQAISSLQNFAIGDKFVLEDIFFENNKSILMEESFPALERVAKLIYDRPNYNFAILGHICCNPPGNDVKDLKTGRYNLSLARARVVYDYLVKKGIDQKRLSYKGLMANFPLGKGEKADRRVEIQVTGIKEE